MSKNSPNTTVSIGGIPRSLKGLTLILAIFLCGAVRLPAEHLYVPNSSFESQVTDYADARVDDWQKTPQPGGFDTGTFGYWTNLSGLFINFPGTPGYIGNADGQQLAFRFAYPQAGFFQDFNSTDWTGAAPAHAFNAIYQSNRTYTLSVGLTSSSAEPLTQGSTLLLALYYRDAASNRVVIASNTVTYDTNVFTNLNQLLDYQVTIPAVHATDPWVGQNVGILIESTVAPSLIGGVWDMDNVRLTEGIYVPNFSFESQPTGFVTAEIDDWQKPPQPSGFDSADFGAWTNMTGLFYNYPGASFIDNANGSQLAYMVAYPQVAIFQDYNSTDWSGASPTHTFNAVFQPGKIYTLTVGVTSSSVEPLTPGSTLQLSLYYRDASSNMVTVASTTVPYDTNIFTNITHLTDIQVRVPAVKSGDAWAGKNIGIQIASTVPPQLLGGVWDIDNVRLVEDYGVPNFSFETPAVDYVGAAIDSWQKPPPPAGFDSGTYGDWTNLSGVFVNFPGPYFVNNADGAQLAYLQAYPQVALFQDVNSTDYSGLPATHDFNVRYEPGKYYSMTVGITSSSVEPVTTGSTLVLSLYYRDASNNAVTIASNTVTFNPSVFTNLLQLLDFSVSVPVVQAGQPWANQNIGIQIQSTVAPNLIGGVWDLDNVRLTGAVPATLSHLAFANGQFRLQLQSDKNAVVAILATTNIALPITNWTTLTTITNFTGSYPVVDIAPDPAHRFYQARKLP